jgi:predicted RNA-binding Zn-ribbon protein involved in translation (DUF1610 family)
MPRDYKKESNLPRGVYVRGCKWGAFTNYKGKKTHLGFFSTPEEAIKARQLAYELLPVEYKDCVSCGKPFELLQRQQKFCCSACKGAYKYITRNVTTQSQYEGISGNWSRYLSRLLYAAGRKRDNLTREELFEILENQNYNCAISGLPLTCNLEVGTKFWSNASVDRIEAGASYTPDNIQLVCRAVNSWRSDMPLSLFISVCKAVANNNQDRLEV